MVSISKIVTQITMAPFCHRISPYNVRFSITIVDSIHASPFPQLFILDLTFLHREKFPCVSKARKLCQALGSAENVSIMTISTNQLRLTGRGYSRLARIVHAREIWVLENALIRTERESGRPPDKHLPLTQHHQRRCERLRPCHWLRKDP